MPILRFSQAFAVPSFPYVPYLFFFVLDCNPVSLRERNLGMPEDASPTPTSLGDLRAMDLDVFCWCNRCFHNAILETAGLIPRFGPHHPVPHLSSKLRCEACGSQDVEARPAWRGLGQVTRHGKLT
jgi:hypothetical protein